MREDVSTKNKQEYSLHLTIQSGEIIRSGAEIASADFFSL